MEATQQYITTEAYNKISEASDLLTGLPDSNRTDEVANILYDAQQQIMEAERQIRELQTQIFFQKGINEEQKKIFEEVRLYAKELRFSHQHISYSLRNILKLEGEPWT